MRKEPYCACGFRGSKHKHAQDPDWWEHLYDHGDWLPPVPFLIYSQLVIEFPVGVLDYGDFIAVRVQLWAEKNGLA